MNKTLSSKYVINTTHSVRKKYYQMLQTSKFLVEHDHKGNEYLPTFSNLLCDIFCSLYLNNAEVMNMDDIHTKYLVNMTILEGLIVSDMYQRIKEKTNFSEATALWATEMFAEKLIKYFAKHRFRKRFKKFQDQHVEEDLEEELTVKTKKSKKKKSFNFLNFFSFLSFNNTNKKNEAEEDEELAKNLKNIKKTVAKAVHKTTGSVALEVNSMKDVVDICNGWELKENALDNLGYKEKIKLAAKLKGNSRFRELAKIIGHLRLLALNSRYAKIRELPHEIYDIVLGDDLFKIHPLEITYLSHPSFQYDFYQRLASKKIMQYELKGTETAGQGSIIVCIDTSGSMFGRPEIMSKGVALGLLEIARADQRNFVGILFGQKGKVKTFAFHKEEAKIYIPNTEPKCVDFVTGLVDFITSFIGGGTDFETPLSTAYYFREKFDVFKDADMIFITDDVCDISEDFIMKYQKLKLKKNFRAYGVLIGMKYQKPGTLRKFCDEILNFNDFTEDLAGDIFSKVSARRKG